MLIYYDLYLPDIPQDKIYKSLIKFWQLVDEDNGLFEFWKIALHKARSKESIIEDIDQHFDSFKLGYINMNYILNEIENI
jgi:hypothetical protein